MGIFVKTRCRAKGTEKDDVYISHGNFEKVTAACTAFRCTPYFSIIVDADKTIRGYLVAMEHLLEICPMKKLTCNWRMNDDDVERYALDREVKSFVFSTETGNWW
jgi:hypothetical protein